MWICVTRLKAGTRGRSADVLELLVHVVRLWTSYNLIQCHSCLTVEKAQHFTVHSRIYFPASLFLNVFHWHTCSFFFEATRDKKVLLGSILPESTSAEQNGEVLLHLNVLHCSLPEFDIGPITATDNGTVCCLWLSWTRKMCLSPLTSHMKAEQSGTSHSLIARGLDEAKTQTKYS